jgi:hypothetical protein
LREERFLSLFNGPRTVVFIEVWSNLINERRHGALNGDFEFVFRLAARRTSCEMFFQNLLFVGG